MMLVILAAAFIVITLCCEWTDCLTLTNGENGCVIAVYPMEEGERFSVGFVHSVNRSPVIDVYEVRSDGIYVMETIYYGFGAGVQTEIEPGQTLSYGDDGEMIVSGFDLKIPTLSYIVGTVSDHTLTIGDTEISLRDLCGRNCQVVFGYQKRLVWQP